MFYGSQGQGGSLTIKFEMVLTLMYQGLYPLGLRLSSSPKKFNHLFSVCASCVVPRASHVLDQCSASGCLPLSHSGAHCLCDCLACCIYLSCRTERRTERPAASFGYGSNIRLEAWWRQNLQGRARLSEPVLLVVPQRLSARRQSWTGPVSLQCLCSLG